MFQVNEDLSIYATRGDTIGFSIGGVYEDGEPYLFEAGDVVRFRVTEKKACENVVLQKDFLVDADTDTVEILLLEEDTRFGGIISKPTDYWYEVELNPLNNPQTIIGYDEDGAKVFKLFPEGKDAEVIEEEEVPLIKELQGSIKKNAEDIGAHKSDCTNPHKVTAEQVGARPDTWMPTAAETGAIASVNGVTPDKDGNVEIPIPKGAVLYEQQELTHQQMDVARYNIGAASIEQVVRVDQDQELSESQQYFARKNIGAISADEIPEGGVGSVDLTDYVKNTDYATADKAGVVKPGTGLSVTNAGAMQIEGATKGAIEKKIGARTPLVPQFIDDIVKAGITTNKISLTDAEKKAAKEWLGVIGKDYEQIATITVTPAADGSLPQHVIFSADSEGNPFELTDFIIKANAAFVSGNKSGLYMYVNNGDPVFANSPIQGAADLAKFSIFFKTEDDGFVRVAHTNTGYANAFYDPSSNIIASRIIAPFNLSYFYGTPVRKIDLFTLTGDTKAWSSGSTFELWGVRV